MQQRLKKNPYLALFDGADPSSSTGIRQPSTTPLQALFIMNDPLAHGASAKFARRVLAASAEELGRIDFAYQHALNRRPTADEQAQCAEFVKTYRERLVSHKTPSDQLDLALWSAMSRVLFSSNEFVFID
jgi:hypothetical protein